MIAVLKEGDEIPAFVLPDVVTGRGIAYASFLRKQRIVLVVPGRDTQGEGWRWFAEASRSAKAFAERDITVLIVADDPTIPGRLPQNFVVLRDEKGAVLHRLGDAPAFYLIGKDTGIKWATRNFPPVAELFRRIDAMPMRKQEMKEH